MTKIINTPIKLSSKFLLLIVMLYVTFSLAADVVAFRFTNLFGLVESGATILFPLTYVLGDVTAEIYGWNIGMKMVWGGLFCEGIFAILILVVINMPFFHGIGEYQAEYKDILGGLWLFVVAGIISNAIAGLLNVFFISKFKVLWSGRAFWVRSILSTCISEFILIFITVMIAFVPAIHFKATMHVFMDAYFLEIIYSIIFAIPAQYLVRLLTRVEHIDVYDYNVNYNPFKILD